MLIIRFSRVGKRNHAQFRVVLTENSAAVKSKPIEVLGGYDPHLKKASLKTDKIKYWVSQGVQFSDSAYNLMVSQGVIEGKKRPVKIKAKPVDESSEEKTEAVAKEEKPAEEKKAGEKEESKPQEEEKKEEAKAEEAPKENQPAATEETEKKQ